MDEHFPFAPVNDHLAALSLADRTRRRYLEVLRDAWTQALDAGTHLDTIGAAELSMLTASWSPVSRRQLRAALGKYWRLIGRADLPLGAILVPPKPRGRCRALEPEDAVLLAKVARDDHPRGTAILLGLYLGLRISEIAKATWERFDPDLAWYTVTGKGGVTAPIPVSEPLRLVLAEVPGPHVGYLFPSIQRRRTHIHQTTVSAWLDVVALRAGFPHIQTHRLRHTAIATVNDITQDLRATQEFARHARAETTQIYTRVTADRLRACADALASAY